MTQFIVLICRSNNNIAFWLKLWLPWYICPKVDLQTESVYIIERLLGCKWAELRFTQYIFSCKKAEHILDVIGFSDVCGRSHESASWIPRPCIRGHGERRAKVQCAPVEM